MKLKDLFKTKAQRKYNDFWNVREEIESEVKDEKI